MSTYKEIKGFKVQTLSADPVVAGTSWSSGGAMNTARYNVGAAGTQTAALAYGGYAGAPVYGTTSPPSGSTNRTESYDGSSWTEVADLNQFRNHGVSFGTQTAAIMSTGISDYAPGPPYGRTTYTETEIWNGSAWTEVNNIPTVLYRISAFGTSTAGITAAGAKNHPATDSSESYSWDGTNWTDGPNVNTPRSYQMGLGTSTAGMIVGGYIQSPASMVGNTEIWNGSAWTEVNDLNTARSQSVGAGTVTAAVAANGTYVESWNGTNWTAITAAPVSLSIGGGTQTAIIANGGSAPDTAVYLWNGSAWTTSAATFSTTHPSGGFSGNPGTAALFFTGSPSGTVNVSSEFNSGTGAATVTFTDA